VIRRGIPFAILAMGLLLAATTVWAGDGDNIFVPAYGSAEDDTLSDSLIRGCAAGSDLDEDGLYEIIVTDYDNGGMVHVYEVTGDNTLEWVWSSAGSNVDNVRQVGTGDLDNDGIGEIIFVGCDGSWSAEYEGEIAADDCWCNGCLSEKGPWMSHCAECGIRACGVEKGVANCAHCSNYGCDKLTEFFGFAPDAKAALDEIRSAL